MKFKIKGTGKALPDKEVTNHQLADMMDTSDQWISSRTGIKSRRIACGETTTSLAVEAARRAMQDAGREAEEVELILVATFTPAQSLPNTASMVQAALGCKRAVAFDLNAACSGFLFAMNTAQAYFSAGIYRNALLIGSETVSKVVDWKDRSTCVLFGDGAGAVFAEAEEGEPMPFVQWTDGSLGQVLALKERSEENPWYQEGKPTEKLTMDGQEVFRFAVRRVPECIRQVLDKACLHEKEVDAFLLHQANQRILEAVAKRLGVPVEKFPMNLQQYGNTSAASIPLLLDEVNKQGILKKDDKVIVSGFGAGLTWGAALLHW